MEREQPTVSIIVPNYNYACYLEVRLKSILSQTFQNFELILLDDASTDGSVAILEKYKNNPHVSHLIVNKENTGSPFCQWMKGIQLARGKWIWIAEADNSCEPDFLETCMRQVTEAGNVAVCMTGSSFIDSNGEVLRMEADYWSKGKQSGSTCYFNGQRYVEHKLYWHSCIMNASSALFRREYALRLSDLPFLSMRYSGDWMFWIGMAMQGDVCEIRKPLNHFRQHTSVSVEGIRTGKRLREDIDVIFYVEKLFPNISRYKKQLRRGMIYRKIRKVKSEGMKTELTAYLRLKMGGSKRDFYILRMNQCLKSVCPFLLTMNKDRDSLACRSL